VHAHLVVAAVFKTVVPCVNRSAGRFDSDALPPFFSRGFVVFFPPELAGCDFSGPFSPGFDGLFGQVSPGIC